MFRKRKDDEAIPEDILAGIPELDDEIGLEAEVKMKKNDDGTVLIHTVEEDGKKAGKNGNGSANAASEAAERILGQMRRQMQDALAREVGVMEQAMQTQLSKVEERLKLANEHLTTLRRENDELLKQKEQYERKLAKLKESLMDS